MPVSPTGRGAGDNGLQTSFETPTPPSERAGKRELLEEFPARPETG